jgi:hypothetical protein
MYLNEVEDERTKQDLALIIEETLKQRMLGIKNEKGVYITPAFPKLIYVLEEDNIHEDSKYYYLTKLAAQCTAKRMVPDYISEKIMKKLKVDRTGNGVCYPVMGCVDGGSVIDYKIGDVRFVESFERAWSRLSKIYEIKEQPDRENLYIDTPDVSIWDNKENRYVKQYRIIRNVQDRWFRVGFSGGRYLNVTDDHPFEIIDKGVVFARDLVIGDSTYRLVANNQTATPTKLNDLMWLKGVIVCDGCYQRTLSISLGLDEYDIADRAQRILYDMKYDSHIVEWHRGVKGNYIELKVHNSGDLSRALSLDFGGYNKIERQIPNYVFNASREDRLSFLAGMIDADGYVNNSGNTIKVQIGSTNEELALQQMMLAEDLGMNVVIYKNHYNSNNPDAIRYRVEFNCTEELVSYLSSVKKASHFDRNHIFLDSTSSFKDTCNVVSIEEVYETKFSYDVTTESEHFMVNGIYSHNCRSALTPDRTETNVSNCLNYYPEKGKYYGRFNQGVTTINLVDIACSSKGDEELFWKIFDERLELCHRALEYRHRKLLGTPSDIAPIMWQHGALARLEKGETIDKLLVGGYSTISLGYAGLYECVKYMKGVSHSDEEVGMPFALKVMKHLNDACARWKYDSNIDYSLYGTPLESTTYKFAKCLQERFGIIEDVTDHNYITNSYHIPVREEIDAFDKLRIESKFQELSPGGAISYVEVPNMQNNIESVLDIIKYIYDHIMYAELNTKSDYCMKCGYDGEIQIVEESGKLLWECPNCKNRDQNTMNVARRSNESQLSV